MILNSVSILVNQIMADISEVTSLEDSNELLKLKFKP